MLVKKLVDIYYYYDERWETRFFPPGVLFHLSHLGPEFRVLCFLMSVPNRVWDSMGSPCLTYLASYSSSGGPNYFTICKRVCAWLVPQQFSNQPGPVRTWFLTG